MSGRTNLDSETPRPARGEAHDATAPAPTAADTEPRRADENRNGAVGPGEERAVDPRTVSVWRGSALLAAVPAAAAGLVPTIAASRDMGPAPWLAYLVLLAVLALAVWAYPAARHRRLRYRVDAVGIVIRDGVVWRTESALPRVRIQHTDVSQGPLQRRYGVATLKLYTAGSRFTRIELPGLAYDDAVALRDRLLEGRVEDAV